VGLATSFLQGSKEEWSLVRRHPSEKIFGVQIAGSKPATLVPAVEAISKICAGGLDFVDLNCGCPIDLVFKTGSGSAREYLAIAREPDDDDIDASTRRGGSVEQEPYRDVEDTRRSTVDGQASDGCERWA
jgi:hypothetical protein